jgi:HEAT repeat protein
MPDDNLKRQMTRLASEHAHERNGARQWFLDHPEGGRPALLNVVTKGEPTHLVREAMYLLAQMGSESDVPVIAAILNRGNGPLAWDSAQALGSHPSKLALQALLDALEHKDPEVVGAAAVALGVRHEDTARKPLEKLLNSENESVRFRAVYGLQKLGAAPSANTLREYQKKETSESVRKLIDEVLSDVSKTPGM